MIFKIFIKEGEKYKECDIVAPTGSDFSFFKSLKMSVEEQLNNIRSDILSFYPHNESPSLVFPKIDDYDLQKKIDKLVEMRTKNTKLKEELNDILSGIEFIICESCGSKMFRAPLGANYEKFGNRFLILNENPNQIVEYIYNCSQCNRCVREDVYNQQKKIKELRNRLLSEGESFVPNEFGFWHWDNKKKTTKPAGLEEESGCNHIYERKVETYKTPIGLKEEKFMKITETCVYCGLTRNIR
jgi:hypothetical protein